MKHSIFIAKSLSLFLICGFLAYYQSVAVAGSDAMAGNRAAVEEREAFNRQVQSENEALLKAAAEQEMTDANAESADGLTDGGNRGEAQAQAAGGLYADGTYEGTGSGYGGTVKVKVSVVGGAIDKIEVTEHGGEDPAYFMLAEDLLPEMIRKQGPDVDAASGATFSSEGIKQAVAAALGQAVRK